MKKKKTLDTIQGGQRRGLMLRTPLPSKQASAPSEFLWKAFSSAQTPSKTQFPPIKKAEQRAKISANPKQASGDCTRFTQNQRLYACNRPPIP
jgi:hypothetical protein